MEDSGDLSPKLTDSLTGWTVVNEKGELLVTDGDSDSSESSIEVVSVEGSDVVSFHHGKRDNVSGQTSKEELSNADTARAVECDGCKEMPAIEAGTNEQSLSNLTDDLNTAHQISIAETDVVCEDSNETVICENEPSALVFEEGLTETPPVDETNKNESVLSVSDVISTTDVEVSNDQVVEDASNGVQSKDFKDEFGACCKDLLLDDELEVSNVMAAKAIEKHELLEQGTSMENCERIELVSQSSSKASSRKGDSDTDSDFVQLDVVNMGDLEAQLGANLDTDDALPLRRFNSVGDNFRFLQNNEAQNLDLLAPQQIINDDQPFMNDDGRRNNDDNESNSASEDTDRDDETESFTEEGIDDRIESDQSEAESAQDDFAGDLSAFADIGDIPLVAGNVPRNYIHCPNNHLSMVLNVTLVLATILAMGMSLGIIMATDLEIEEWQNAYELQTLRVRQLEHQLREVGSKDKVVHLETLNEQLKAKLVKAKLQNMEYRKTQIALEWLEANSKVEGGQLSKAAYLVRKVVQIIVHCPEYDDLTSGGINEGDNGSFVSLGPCVEQLGDLMNKLKVLAGVEIDTGASGAHIATDDQNHGGINTEQGVKYVHDNTDNTENGLTGSDVITKNTDTISLHGNGNEQQKSHDQPSDVDENIGGIVKMVHDQNKVKLDIGQLQQSLSREQERAVYWQSLYLSERRQRERERENEEWEDERDQQQRKDWERQEREKCRTTQSRADLDDLECFKKLMSSNLTTLTRYVTKWNISASDDFANLSVLLTNVQALKETVIDSLHKAWLVAEPVVEKIHSFGSRQSGSENESNGNEEYFKIKDIKKLLLSIIASIQDNNLPQLEKLFQNFQVKFRQIKEIMNASQIASGLASAFNLTEEVFVHISKDIDLILVHKELVVEYLRSLMESFPGEKAEETTKGSSSVSNMEEKKHKLQEYINKYRFDDFHLSTRDEDSGNEDVDYHDFEVLDHEENADDILDLRLEKNSQEHEDRIIGVQNDMKVDDEQDDDDEDDDDEIDNYDEKMESVKSSDNEGKTSWSKGIRKFWTRTHKSLKQLGSKVSSTFGEIRHIWKKKKQPLIRIAKHLTSKFVRASVKLTKMCTRLPSTLFKDSAFKSEEGHMFIHNKCVKKLRKQWQKQLLNDPCKAAGALSHECHLNEKTLKQDIKEVSKLFDHLLKIKTFEPEGTLRMSKEDVTLHYELFKSFMERWGGRHLLLKKDLQWVVCQRDWWSDVLQASGTQSASIRENKCDIFTPEISFYPGGDIQKLNAKDYKETKHSNKENVQHLQHKKVEDLKDVNAIQKTDAKYKKAHFDSPKMGNETGKDELKPVQENDEDWHVARRKQKLQNRREKEKKQKPKEIHTFNSGTQDDFRNRKGNKDDWLLRKAHEREMQRKEERKAEWLFERAKHRRKRHDDGNDEIDDGNWALKQSHYREQRRQEEHKADWLFDRASDRKEKRGPEHMHCKENGERYEEFRCAYGKVSSP